MMAKPFLSVVASAAIYAFLTPSAFATASTAYLFKNTTSYYLHRANDDHPDCPKVIKPGETVAIDAYAWCGFDACATDRFEVSSDPNKGGCLEKGLSDDLKTIVERQGGYAAYFHPNLQDKSCTVPSEVYSCKLTEKNGINEFSLDYNPIQQTYSGGPNKGQVVTLPTITNFKKGPVFRGINISGLEYDGTFLDAMYQRPDIPDLQYFAEQHMNTVRLPIRWEFLVATTQDNIVDSKDPVSPHLNTQYLAAIKDTVKKYLRAGLIVNLDLHNYMRFCGAGTDIGQLNEPTDPIINHCKVVNGIELAYIWGTIADQFADLAKSYPDHLMFELMNEPYSYVNPETQEPVPGQIIKTEDLLQMEALAVQAIRKRGLNNYILLSGNYWDPLHEWTTHAPISGDVPNGTVFTAQKLKAAGIENLDRIIMDVHQYFDSNYSGTHRACMDFGTYSQFQKTLGLVDKDGVDIFKNWYTTNHMKIFLGEFGASLEPECQKALNYMLMYVNDHAYNASKNEDGGFIGWTVWRANRHGGDNVIFAPFNFLQKENYTVWRAPGYRTNDGTGITQGPGNDLMNKVLATYLQ